MVTTMTTEDQRMDEDSTLELAVEKPAAKKPAAKKSAAEKPAAKKPAVKKRAAPRTEETAVEVQDEQTVVDIQDAEAVVEVQEPDASLRRVLLDIETDSAKRLAIATTSGDIRVEAHDVPRVIVETSNGAADLSGVDISIGKNRTVYAGIKNNTGLKRLFRKRTMNDADMIVKIPAEFGVEVRTDSGNISIEGIEGRVKATAKKGDVTLKDVNGKVSVRTRSGGISGNVTGRHVRCTTLGGNIDLSGLAGSMKCKSWSGDIKLEWAETPSAATVDLGVGQGAIDIRLPESTRLNYQFIVGLASIMNEFEQVSDSDFKMRVVSKRGSLSLRKSTS